MKKLLIGLAFSFICFSGFALQPDATFNACGSQNLINMMYNIHDNLCVGHYEIIDLCNDDEFGSPVTVVVNNYEDGPNSSCNGLFTVE